MTTLDIQPGVTLRHMAYTPGVEPVQERRRRPHPVLLFLIGWIVGLLVAVPVFYAGRASAPDKAPVECNRAITALFVSLTDQAPAGVAPVRESSEQIVADMNVCRVSGGLAPAT